MLHDSMWADKAGLTKRDIKLGSAERETQIAACGIRRRHCHTGCTAHRFQPEPENCQIRPSGRPAPLDPLQTTTSVTRNHGHLVFDTLYSMDENLQPQPQMMDGHNTADNGKTWELTLRDGLKFHDSEPVRATDVVASIRRWSVPDPLGSMLMAQTDKLAAPTDRVVRFRLKKSFPLLP